MLKRILNIVLLISALIGIATPVMSQQAPSVLTNFDFTIVGVTLQVGPEYQAVPKGIASQVTTGFVSSGQPLPESVLNMLPKDFKVVADFTGPGFPSRIELSTYPGKAFDLPTLPVLGKYSLSNIRLIDGSGNPLIAASPQAVTIESIKDPLITSVTTRPLTLQEIQDRGVTVDSTNFTAYEFTAILGTESKQIPVTFPVLIPDTSKMLEDPSDVTNPSIGIDLPRVDTLKITELPDNFSLAGFNLTSSSDIGEQFGSGGIALPPIPGIVVIPGNIGFLHQYFSALAIVSNGAPGMSGLVVKDLQARIILPLGDDKAPGTDDKPGDDPLRMAKGADGYFPRMMTVVNAGPDGKIGTSDDISRLYPAESGQADFTIEGLKEGTHKIDFEITATLEGLPIGPISLKGKATGAVLVRNPDFSVTLGHPATVRSGEQYDLFVTITNTSLAFANRVSVHLDPRALSGAVMVASESPDKLIDEILPGSSATVRYRLLSQRTGAVTATAFASDDVKGRFILRMGVGELGIPLSPDSLIIPYTGELTPDLVIAAVGLLGQAWSVATAPTGALPADVLPIGKSIITGRSNDLSEAGLRILMGETAIKAIEDFSFDFLGSDNANNGFDSLRRRSTQGLLLNTALAALFQAEAATTGIFNFQAHFGEQASYRPGHISVVTSEAAVRVRLTDVSGNKIGGLSQDESNRGIPYADQLTLSSECGVQSSGCNQSTLSLITKIESTSYKVEVAAEGPGVFDLGIVLPDAAGTLRQVRFANVVVVTGSRGSITLLPGTTTDYVLSFDDNADGTPDRTVAPSAVYVIPDPGPAVVAVTQLSPGFGPGGDKHGRNVAVLYSERVTKETGQDLANYAVEENAVRMAYHQPSGRMTFLLLRDGVGPLVPRSMTVSGMKDPRGNSMSPSSTTLPIRMTAQGPAAIVKGTVRLPNGQPVPGATIRLMQYVWYSDGIERVQKYAVFSAKPAKADGSYQFDYVFQNDDPTGAFMIDATNPETNEAASISAAVVIHGQVISVDLFMKAKGSVIGTVRDSNGNAVPNTTVLLTPQGSIGLLTTTDGTGAFSFTNVRVGAFSLKAVNQSLLSEGTTMGILGDDGVVVVQDIAIYKIADTQTGTVTGKVLESDGVTPRAGAVVIVEADRYKNWTRTNADGVYTIEGVFAGTVTASATDQLTGQESSVSASLANNGTVVLNIIFKGLGTIIGKVVREDGKSVAGLPIMAVAVNTPLSRVTTTAADGTFSFGDMPVGDLRVSVHDPVTYGKLGESMVSLLSAGSTENVSLFIPAKAFALGTIEGTVYRRDGSVYPFVKIYKVDFGEEKVVLVATTNAQGRYTIPDMSLGTYPLVVKQGTDVANGWATLWYDTQIEELDLRMTGIGTVTGTITDTAGTNPDGTPAIMPVGADVTLTSMVPSKLGWLEFKTSATVKSDPQTGRYTFTGVYAGNVTVGARNIFRPTLVSKSGILGGEGQSVLLDLMLKDTFGSISGLAVLPDGKTPVGEGIKVTVMYGGQSPVTVTTDPDGKFQFEPVIPEGKYAVTAYDEMTTLTGRSSVYVPAGQDVPVTVRLLGRGTMTVRTFFADGTSAPNADVTVKGSDFPNNTASGTTDQNGIIIFSNLSEGAYAVSALGSYNRGGRANVVIPGDNAFVTVDVTLAASGTVTGRFLKPDGVTPIGGGQIKLKNAFGAVIAYGYSSSDTATLGEFRLDYIPLGDFKLEGYDPITERIGFGGGRISADGQTASADIIVTPRGTVKGTVLNNTGTAPVDRATMEISVTGVQGLSYATVSAPDGAFLFAGVTAGTFNIKGTDPATGLVGNASGTLTYESETVRADVRLQSSGTIEGTVYLPDGTTPAVNADVCYSLATCITKLRVDVDGRYRFINLVAGKSYPIYATEGGTMRAGQTSATISREGEIVTADIVLNGIGSVTGTIFDTDGTTPLPDAKVTIGFVKANYTAYSDASGNYSFTNVPAGSFTIQATHPQRITAASASGTLTSEGQVVIQNLTLAPVGAITGTVLMPDATTPARGGGIKYTGCSRSFTAVIDTNGLFQFTNMPLCSSFTLYFEDATGAAIGYASGSLTTGGETLNVGTTILDDKAIAVAEVVPATGAVNVPVNSSVTVFFSEPARAATINSSTVYLMKGSTIVYAPPVLSPDGKSAIITPSQALASFSLYTVVVSGVEDLVYHKLPQAFTSTFTTIDSTPPTVASVYPLSNAVEIAPDGTVRVTFSESIDQTTTGDVKLLLNSTAVNAQIDLTQGNTVAIITPVGGLLSNSTYTVSVSGVKDAAGNTLVGTFVSSFNTVDTIVPTITGLTYPPTADLIKGNTVPFTVTVADTDVAFVDFFMDDVHVATDNVAPYTQNITLTKEGTVLLKAVAQDKIGNRGLSYPQPALALEVKPDTPPTVAITQPSSGSTVNTGSSFTVTVTAQDDLFAKEITLTATGEVTFSQTKTNTSGKTFSPSFSITVPQGATPGGPITLTATAKDSAGQSSALPATVTVQVHDSLAPSVTVTSPGQTVRYKPGESGTATVTAADNIGVTSLACSVSGPATGNETFTIDPAQKTTTQTFAFQVLSSATPHAAVTISCIAKDGTANQAAGSVTIYVADLVPPVIMSSSITDNAVNVPATAAVTVSFDEPLAASTVSSETVGLVEDATGQSFTGAVALSNDHKIVTFTPAASMSLGTAYRFTIAKALTDEAGNALANDFVLHFTTIPPDITPPVVSSITPANGGQGVSVAANVTVLFNEPVNPNTVTKDVFIVTSAAGPVTGAITFTQGNTVVTFRPLAQLGFNTDYTVTLKAGIQDTVGNATTSDVTSTFKTGGFGITSPKNNAALIQGRTLSLTAVADSGQGITSVKFYVNSVLAGTKTGAPYTMSYTVPQNGDTEQLTITAEGVTSGASIWAPGIGVISLVGDQDSDGDGLTNAQEVDAGTDPLTPDAYADPDNDGLTNTEEISLGTDPNNADTDGDGLTDGEEVRTYHTNPLKADTDGDALKDGEEINTYFTDPLNPDTDGDGLPDGWEVKYSYDPAKADSDGNGTPDGEEDPDADGLRNKYEYCLGLNPKSNKTDGTNLDANRDDDRDGWTNIYEVNTSHTSPCLADTDGDGVIDPDEKNVLLTDPNNKNDLYGTDFTLSGGKTIRIEGKAYFNNLIITGNSTITALSASTTQVSKAEIEVVGNLNIDAGSKIDVSARGYLGGYAGGNNSYNGRTIGNTNTGGSYLYSGGSYGGLGGMYSTHAVNAAYGDLMNPDEVGSGGGGQSTSYPGGNGGGLVKIKVGTLTVDGSIVADGGDSPTNAYDGAGSGGGVLISVATLSGTGTISAKGGASAYAGAGGGGRIAVYSVNKTGFAGTVSASGGLSGSGGTLSRNGSAGTVYYQELLDGTPQTVGKLHISNLNSDYPSVQSNSIVPANSDFSAQLYFSDMALDSSDGGWDDGFSLRITDASNAGTYVELKVRPHQGSGFSYYNVTNGGWGSPWGGDASRYNTDGFIRIERAGTTYKFYIQDGRNGTWQLGYSLVKTSYQAKIEIITHRNVDYHIDNFFLSSSQNFVGSNVNTFADDFNSYLDGAPLNSSWWQIPGNLDVCQIKVTNVP